jgi:aminoglycoside phosphotransferase (APT) family kinase protein
MLNFAHPSQVEIFLRAPELQAELGRWLVGPLEVQPLSEAPDRCFTYTVQAENGRCVVRIPRDHAQELALRKEARLIQHLHGVVNVDIPDTTFFPAHDGFPAYAIYRWVEGEPLTSDMVQHMPEASKQELADDLAEFLIRMHNVTLSEAVRWCDPAFAGSTAELLERYGKPAWFAGETRQRAVTRLKPFIDGWLAELLDQTVARFEGLELNETFLVLGHGDVHGFNLAMRLTASGYKLGGVLDFGISGIQDVHEDLFRLNFVGAELLQRVVHAYVQRGGKHRQIDAVRIELYWRAFLFYLMLEQLEANQMPRFDEYQKMLIGHVAQGGREKPCQTYKAELPS